MKNFEQIKPENTGRKNSSEKERKEAATAIVVNISKELNGGKESNISNDDALKQLIANVLKDSRTDKKSDLRLYEREWLDVITNVLNQPSSNLRENKDDIQRLLAFQRKNQMETDEQFF